jgi:hypothetical protein
MGSREDQREGLAYLKASWEESRDRWLLRGNWTRRGRWTARGTDD